MTQPRPNPHAFTLLELILVLAVIGLLLGVAAPALQGMVRSGRVDHTATLLLAMLHAGRATATADAQVVRLVIDPDEHEVWLETLTPQGFVEPATAAARRRPFDAFVTVERTDEAFVPEANGRIAVLLGPDGRVEAAQLVVTDDTGRARAVYALSPAERFRIGAPLDGRAWREVTDAR